MDEYAQSGNGGALGTSGYNTGTTSDAGGGADYLSDFLKIAGNVALAAVTPRTSPAVQPQLTTVTPTQQPASNAPAFSLGVFVAQNRVALAVVGILALGLVAYRLTK